MPTYDFTNGSVQGPLRPLPLPVEKGDITPVRNIVDFSQQALDAGLGDVGRVLNIPAGTTVLYVTALPLTDADGNLPAANTTIDVGTGIDVDQFGAGLSMAASQYGTALFAPLYLAAADTIDIKATTDGADVNITTGRVEITAFCIKH